MKCRNCGKEILSLGKFCSNCGSALNNNQVISTTENITKKSQIDNFERKTTFLIPVMLGIYVVISCFNVGMSQNVDGSVSGLFVIFGIPIGLFICELFPIINIVISSINKQKKKKNSYILKIIFNIITIFALNFFYSNFLAGTVDKGIYFYINILMIIISSIFAVMNMKVYKSVE